MSWPPKLFHPQFDKECKQRKQIANSEDDEGARKVVQRYGALCWTIDWALDAFSNILPRYLFEVETLQDSAFPQNGNTVVQKKYIIYLIDEHEPIKNYPLLNASLYGLPFCNKIDARCRTLPSKRRPRVRPHSPVETLTKRSNILYANWEGWNARMIVTIYVINNEHVHLPTQQRSVH